MIDVVVVATRNKKKGDEILDLLKPHGIKVLSVNDFPNIPEVIEDGSTFGENAGKKAAQTAKIISHYVIGEDSGICINALGGKPGINSARYSGEQATDQSNNEKMISELKDVPLEKRGAHYVCHISLSDPDGNIILNVERSCQGRIIFTPRGTNGFGYDPYFEIPEYHQTFGELSPVVKKYLSHRARAFQEFIPKLLSLKTS